MGESRAAMDGCCEPGDRERRCVFAKALLSRVAGCECATRVSVAEGEWTECASPEARHACATLLATMHERARFSLKLPAPGRALLHLQAMRLQCGGLLALRAELDGDGPACTGAADTRSARVPNVRRLTLLAHERFEGVADLPWERIVPATAAWAPRRRLAPRAADHAS